MDVIVKSIYNWQIFILVALQVGLHSAVSIGQKQKQHKDLSVTVQNQNGYSKGLVFHRQLKFDSAIIFYQNYRKGLDQVRDRNKVKEVEKRISECESGRKLMNEPRKFTIVNLGPEVNSPFEDYAPVLTEDESLLVFTSRRSVGNVSGQKASDGKYFEDVFFASMKDNTWSSAKNMGVPVNTPLPYSHTAL